MPTFCLPCATDVTACDNLSQTFSLRISILAKTEGGRDLGTKLEVGNTSKKMINNKICALLCFTIFTSWEPAVSSNGWHDITLNPLQKPGVCYYTSKKGF